MFDRFNACHTFLKATIYFEITDERNVGPATESTFYFPVERVLTNDV